MQPFFNYKLALLCLAVFISACGGGGGSEGAQNTNVLSDETYSLSGRASALPGAVTLSSGSETVVVENEGLFRFPDGYRVGQTVSVEVVSAPETYACFVENSVITFSDQNVSNLRVSCQRNAFSVSGTVFGLEGDLELTLAEETITVTEDGEFEFSTLFQVGDEYSISLGEEEGRNGRGETSVEDYECRVSFAEGVITGQVTSPRIVCREYPDNPELFVLSGTAAGFSGSFTLLNADNVTQRLEVSSSDITFEEKFSPNDTYDLRIVSQPEGYVCQVENGVGQFTNSNIEDLRVSCLAIVGEIKNLNGTLELSLAGVNVVSFSSNGSASSTVLVDKTIKDNFVGTIAIVGMPENQVCSFQGGGNLISVAQDDQRFSALVIDCQPKTYTMGGSVTGVSSGIVSFDVYESLAPERIKSFDLNVAESNTFEVTELFRKDQYVSVEVSASPDGFICQALSSQIKLTQDDTSSVIHCRPEQYQVSVNVQDLDGEVTIGFLENGNIGVGDQTLSVSENGLVTFPNSFPDGATAQLIVFDQPEFQTCTPADDLLDVTEGSVQFELSCVYRGFLVSGRVEGLPEAQQLKVRMGEQIAEVASGESTFMFDRRVLAGDTLDVRVEEVPELYRGDYRCEAVSVDEMPSNDLSDVVVSCTFGATLAGKIYSPNTITADSDTNDPLQTPLIENNTLSDAQQIYDLRTVYGFVAALDNSVTEGRFAGSSDPNDFFSTRLEANQVLVLDSVSSGDGLSVFDVELYVYDEAGNDLMISSTSVAGTERLTIRETGRYYIHIYASSGAGRYALRIAEPAEGVPMFGLASNFAQGQAVVLFDSSDPRMRSQAAPLDGSVTNFDLARASLIEFDIVHDQRFAEFEQELKLLNAETLDKLYTLERVKEYQLRPDVEHASVNQFIKSSAVSLDPLVDKQWAHERINLNAAWDVTTGDSSSGEEVIVAVLDDGMLTDHEEFTGRLLPGYDFVSDSANSGDNDGIDSDPYDSFDNGHGTHVAGIIAANAENRVGIAGVSWKAKIMPVRVIGGSGGNVYDLMQAIRYAARLSNNSNALPVRRADIINMSLSVVGSGEEMILFRNTLEEARAAGVILIASSGNLDSEEPPSSIRYVNYPAAFDGVVAVGATDYSGNKASYSHYGSALDVMAPGGDLVTDLHYPNDGIVDGVVSSYGSQAAIYIEDGEELAFSPALENIRYEAISGTSMAAPHVAGVAALMKAIFPELSPAQFDSLLAQGLLTNDMGGEGREDLFGHGLINAEKAVNAAVSLRDNPSELIVPDLRVSSSYLELTSVAKFALLDVMNASDEGSVQSITSDQSWLSITASAGLVDDEGFGQYEVRAQTTDLLDDQYFGTITIDIGGGLTKEVSVSLTLIPVDGQQIESPFYVDMYLEESDKSNYPWTKKTVTATNTGLGVWSYNINGIKPGEYTVVATTDIDQDELLCGFAEVCGFLVDDNDGTIIDIGLQGQDNADIEAELITTQ